MEIPDPMNLPRIEEHSKEEDPQEQRIPESTKKVPPIRPNGRDRLLARLPSKWIKVSYVVATLLLLSILYLLRATFGVRMKMGEETAGEVRQMTFEDVAIP